MADIVWGNLSSPVSLGLFDLHMVQNDALTAKIGNNFSTFTTSGTAPAFALTPTIPLVAYAAGNRFNVIFNANGTTGSNTLNVSLLGAQNLKQYNGSGLKIPATIISGMVVDVEYDGVDFVVLGGVATPVGNFSQEGNQTSNATFTASQSGSLIALTGATTSVQLPALSAMPDGGTITLINLTASAAINVVIQGADTIYGGNLVAAAACNLNKGECATYSKNALLAAWMVTASNVNFFGAPQTWQNMTGSRALGTTYTNSTGREIKLSATITLAASQSAVLTVAGVQVASPSTGTSAAGVTIFSTIPAGATYVIGSAGTLTMWAEER